MKITFVIFAKVHAPIGGVKVVYEYANRLADRGNEVTIVHAVVPNRGDSALRKAGKLLRHSVRRVAGRHTAASWFALRPAVRQEWVRQPDEAAVPDGDVVIATAWSTAEWVAAYSPRKGAKAYLLQHRETWAGDPARVEATWKLPLHKIAVARWLVEHAASLGERAAYIPNGLDFSSFGIVRPLEERAPNAIALLGHWRPYKGTRDAVEALRRARTARDLEVTMFGVMPRPGWVPSWVRYVRNPSQAHLRQLYNDAALFIAPSHEEGWGLPACEAMMCGCALLASDVGGHREFAVPGTTAMVFPPGDVDALVRSILHCTDDSTLRVRIAREGARHVRQYTWERAVAAFEGELVRLAQPNA
jgi:glycosyltransferase involved in cell wall biosynthesis